MQKAPGLVSMRAIISENTPLPSLTQAFFILCLTPDESKRLTVLADADSQLPASSLQVCYLAFLALFPDVTRSKQSTWRTGGAGDRGNILFWGDEFRWIKPKIVRMHGSESFSAILEPPRESELDCCHDPAHFPFKNTVIQNATHSGSSQ